jgi:hypothetical protein
MTMKKICLSLIAGLLCSFAASAQVTIKPGIGFTVADFSKNANGTAKGKAGFQIGGSVAFGKKFYIEPGIFYVGKSTNFTNSNASSDEVHFQLKGVRVPVAVGLNVLGNEESTATLRLFGGGSGFFITSTDALDKSYINTTQWGAFAGLGVDVWKLFLDVSYEWSLTNIQKDITAIDIGKSRAVFVTAGFRINL